MRTIPPLPGHVPPPGAAHALPPSPAGRHRPTPGTRGAFADHLPPTRPGRAGAAVSHAPPPLPRQPAVPHRDGAPPRQPARSRRHDDALDPLARQTAQLAPPPGGPPPPSPPAPAAATEPAAAAEIRGRASLEDLLSALVRKVAWSGDGRRGAVRLEIGAGSLAGATLVVQADRGRVRVHLSAPPGVDLDGWRARIAGRLAARGLEVDD